MTNFQNSNRFKTILVIVIGLTALAWIFTIVWLDKVAFAIGVLAIFIPAAARWIEWTWLKIAFALGWVNSRILLTVVYFVFLLPIAWVSRFFTKDPLKLKSKNASTLYVTRNHRYTKQDLENIW